MDETDLLSMLGPEPTAQEKAQAMANALRGRRTADIQQQAGLLGQLTGDRVLSPLGHSLQAASQQGYARADTEDRNQAMAQYHQDLVAARNQPKFVTAGDKESGAWDPKARTFTPLTDAPPPRPLARALGKGGAGKGAGAPEAPVTLETAQPWELAAARDYAKTGHLPPLGKDVTAKKRILSLSSIINGDGGVAESAAGFGSDAKSLGHAQQQADAVNGFIGTFDKNLELLEESAKKLHSSNSPFINKGLRWFQENGEGDPNLTAFKNALNTVTSEGAKINSGQTGSSGAPISVIQEMEHNLPATSTPAQITAALRVLRRDSENRREALAKNIADIKVRMSGKKAPAPAPEGGAKSGAPAPAMDRKARIQARARELDPDGKMDPEALKKQLRAEFPPEVAAR